MNQIVLQPCGSPGSDSRERYRNTIEGSVSQQLLSEHLSNEDMHVLRTIYKSVSIPTWGVTYGKIGGNYNRWKQMLPGALALFSGDNQIFAYGYVSHKVHAKDLALELWGTDDKNLTWEYVHFVNKITRCRIPVAEFSEVVRYKPKYRMQKYELLKGEKADWLIKHLDLEQPILKAQTQSLIAYEGMESLDRSTEVLSRIEQSRIRKALFHSHNEAECALCGRLFPISFLVAAHVKKRAKCTLEERLDCYVVMPACVFGCDSLYEKGVIFVDGKGRIKCKESKHHTEPIQNHLSLLRDRICTFWNEHSKIYFKWHRESIFVY